MTVFDVAILGGGAAGRVAARVVDRHGASVVRAALSGEPNAGGDDGVLKVWSLGGGPLAPAGGPGETFRLDALADGGSFSVRARALIWYPDPLDRLIPFPGWTLTGVVGPAEARDLARSGGIAPGTRIVVAGCGPELAPVAAAMARDGGTVTALVDLAARGAWPPGGATPRSVLAAGIPVLCGHRVVRAMGSARVAAVEIGPVSGGAPLVVPCDLLCVGHGSVPGTEVSRLYRADHAWRPELGGWVPVVDPWGRTSVPLLYRASDGAPAARAALHDLGLAAAPPYPKERPAPRGAAATILAAAAARAIPSDCVVCRCETITRAAIDAAIDAGARTLTQLKQFTRCGMGPCQGRICGEAAAELVAARAGGRVAVGCFTARVPLRPVPLDALVGAFAYADIPVPPPAPI